MRCRHPGNYFRAVVTALHWHPSEYALTTFWVEYDCKNDLHLPADGARDLRSERYFRRCS